MRLCFQINVYTYMFHLLHAYVLFNLTLNYTQVGLVTVSQLGCTVTT